MKSFVVSDLHFGHLNIIKYCNRPFANPMVMNSALVGNWNSVVTYDDTVYFLGDFSMGNRHSIFHDRCLFDGLIAKKIIMITGNHDRNFAHYDKNGMRLGKVKNLEQVTDYWTKVGFHEVHTEPIVLYDKLILSHEPLPDPGKYINIHGHLHDKNMEGGNYLNVSVEQTNYFPISLEAIMGFYGFEENL